MFSHDFDAQYVFILVSDSDLDAIVDVAVIPLGIEHNRTPSAAISKRCFVNIEALSGVATGWHRDEVLNGSFYDLVVSGPKSFLCPVVFAVVAKQKHQRKYKANGRKQQEHLSFKSFLWVTGAFQSPSNQRCQQDADRSQRENR